MSTISPVNTMSPVNTKPCLDIKDLSVSKSTKPVLSQINLSLNASTFVGLIGPNGAGKSTLLRTLIGAHPLDKGTIRLGEPLRPYHDMPLSERAKHVSYLPQERPVYWPMPVESIVRLGRYAWGSALTDPDTNNSVEQAMEKTGTLAFKGRSMHQLSGGEQARVHLARLLIAQTPIILADEPASALDPHHQFSLMQTLQNSAKNGTLVIAALHDLSMAAQFCDHLVVLDKGNKITEGPPEYVLTPNLLQSTFQVTGSINPETKQLSLCPYP